MKWLMEFVKTHQITLGLENKEGDSVATLCNEPETLRGRSVHSLPLTSYHCGTSALFFTTRIFLFTLLYVYTAVLQTDNVKCTIVCSFPQYQKRLF